MQAVEGEWLGDARVQEESEDNEKDNSQAGVHGVQDSQAESDQEVQDFHNRRERGIL